MDYGLADGKDVARVAKTLGCTRTVGLEAYYAGLDGGCHAREAAAGQRTRNMMICEGKKAQAEQPNIIRSLLRKRPQN
jgi:hypothetical protein